MKKILLFLICLFGIFGMTSCNGLTDVAVGEVSNTTPTSISSSYVKLSGVRNYTINTTGETVVHVEIVTESGDFAIKIGENGLDAYNGNKMQTCSFDVTLSTVGSYSVVVTTKNHKGSYKLTW